MRGTALLAIINTAFIGLGLPGSLLDGAIGYAQRRLEARKKERMVYAG